MHRMDTVDLGLAFLLGILVKRLSEHLLVAMDSGAKLVIMPTQNAADLGRIPSKMLNMIRLDFYSKPEQAAFKSLADSIFSKTQTVSEYQTIDNSKTCLI